MEANRATRRMSTSPSTRRSRDAVLAEIAAACGPVTGPQAAGRPGEGHHAIGRGRTIAWGFGLVVALAIPGAATAQSGWALAGSIVAADTGEPVGSARVRWVEQGRELVTGADGRFLLLDVHGDAATLLVESFGYDPETVSVDRSGASTTVRVRLTPEAFELSGLDVEVTTTATTLDAAQSTTRMTRLEISEDRGQTLGETIESIEGVSVIQYGPSLAKPVVRGLHSQRLIVMNDGIRQEGQQWGGEHAPEIDVFGVDEIEVVRGPGSVLYGSDALGGVIRVEPAGAPEGTDLGGEVVVNSFTNNRQASGSAMVEHGRLDLPLIGRVGGRFRVSGRKAGDAAAADINLANTGFTELNFGATLGAVRPWGGVELDYSRFDSDIGLFTGAHVGNFEDLQRAMERGPRPSDFDYAIENPRQEVTHDAVRLEGHVHSDLGTIETSYGFQLNRRREYDNHGPLANRERPAFGLDLYTHTVETRLRHERFLGLEGTVGFSGMRQGNISKGKAFLVPQYRLYTGSVYASEEADLGPVTVTAGVRYEYRWQRVFEFTDAGIDVPDETRVYDGVASAFGISVPLGDTWSVGATTGRAWRAPNVNERHSQGVHHGTAQYELGDASLRTERTWNVDGTLRRAGTAIDLQLSAYRNQISDYIFLQPREPVLSIRGAYPAFQFQQTNAVITGVEASFTARPVAGLEVRGSGSALRGTDKRTAAPLFDMPADRLQLGVRWVLPSTSWTSLPFIDVGATVVRDQERVPDGTIYALPTDGYRLVDLELGARSVSIGNRSFVVGIEVRNVFDTAYRDYLSRYKLFVDDVGRDIVFRARFPFGSAF